MMTYNIIATGSTGNAVLVNDSILIDCGVAFKKLEPYIKDLRLVLLTHSHGDHFKPTTARALHKQRPALRWGCCEWMVGPLLEAGVDKRVIDVLTLDKLQSYVFYGGGNEPTQMIIMASEIPHNVRNCCYRLRLPPGGEWIFYATDCSSLSGIAAEGYDYYFLEANHTRAEIEARIAAKRAAGEFAYEEAARHNHLSQEQALDWLAGNMGPNSRYIFLHQHREKGENNADK